MIATFTVTPVLASLLLPEHVEETETLFVRALRAVYTPVLRWALDNRGVVVALGLVFLVVQPALLATRLGSEFLPALEEGNFWIRASMPPTMSLDAGYRRNQQDARNPAAPSGGRHGRVAARPARQRQRRLAASPMSSSSCR